MLLPAASTGQRKASDRDSAGVFALNLPAGPYAAGVRVVRQYDYRRSFWPVYDELGQRDTHPPARPLQTVIWYPARPARKATPMRWGDYVAMDLYDTDFRSRTAADSAAFRREAVPKRFLADSAKIARHYDRRSHGYWNAPEQPGRFQAVVYAPSFGASVWENAALCEYLASHGYVVVAVPSMGRQSRSMTPDAAGLNAQADDLAFLVAFVRSLPQYDGGPLGVVGFSWGGMAAQLAAVRHRGFAAVVALDGSQRYFTSVFQTACNQADTALVPLTAPLLYIAQKADPSRPDDAAATGVPAFPLWGRMPFADRSFLRMHTMNHGDFSANHHLFESHGEAGSAPEAVRHQGYAWACRYTRAFLDAHLKRDQQATAFLARGPQANGLGPDLARWVHAPAVAEPPSANHLRHLAKQAGWAQAIAQYDSLAAALPGYELPVDAVWGVGQALLQQQEAAAAVSLFRAASGRHPESPQLWYGLGQAQEAAEQRDAAVAAYRKVLQLAPGAQVAREALARLGAE